MPVLVMDVGIMAVTVSEGCMSMLVRVRLLAIPIEIV